MPLTAPQADLEFLRTWIGKEEVESDVVTSDLVRKFYATFDCQTSAVEEGATAPQLIHFCLSVPVAQTSVLGSDGHIALGGFLPPVPLPVRMWAGGDITFHKDLRVGDSVVRRSRIEDVVLKHGHAGTLCFVTVSHAYYVADDLAVQETKTLVYRGNVRPASAKQAIPAEPGVHRKMVHPSATLLFRYSALTFNGHRIHYDEPYATKVEGYRGLVVHGPLQATLLLNFAAEVHGSPPKRFSFRSHSPLFAEEPLHLNADPQGDSMKLWTAADSGPHAMVAEAAWH